MPAGRKVLRIVLFLLLAGTITIWPVAVDAGDPAFSRSQSGDGRLKIERSVADALIGFYRRFLSPVGGHRCVMYPSCSEYARQAINTYGWVLGLILSVDRLVREGEEASRGDAIFVNNEWRFFDPLLYNSFWLTGKPGCGRHGGGRKKQGEADIDIY